MARLHRYQLTPFIFEDFNPLDTVLCVVEPFGEYARGAQIEDQTEVSAVLASNNAVNVVARQVSVMSIMNLTDNSLVN